MNAYFQEQLDLLSLERKEDEALYKKLIQSAGATQQRENGFAWYPIAIRGQDIGRGSYLSLEVERTTHQHLAHSLQSGRKAELFSNYDPQEEPVKGVIQHVNGNRLRITLFTEELPDWSRHGKLGIRCLFDDDSYDAMEVALKTAGNTAEKNPLIQLLTGNGHPTIQKTISRIEIAHLNTSQNEAVNNAVTSNELAIIHGPPGTGKTTTLVEVVRELLKTASKPILVIAPSNTAIDLICERLAGKEVNVVRIGNPMRVSDELQKLTLDHRVSTHPDHKRIKELRKRASEFRNMAHKYKRNFGPEERQQRKALFAEAGRISHEIANLEDFIIEDELHRAQVIAATPVGANNFSIKELSFDTVIIDEAGQALEPACWIPILKARKVILAGDHLQLPPTVKSDIAARAGLTKTLMEKCVGYYPEVSTLLREQYRMHSMIMQFPSGQFYGNKLVASPSVSEVRITEDDLPLLFIDTAGSGFEEKPSGTSFINPEEGEFLTRNLYEYLIQLKKSGIETSPLSIGVISPYKQQVELLKQTIENHPFFPDWSPQITVNTIDGFQGQERDIIFIGMVRSNQEGVTGFLNETRRMNVAMTRAKKKLVVIGDSATLSRQAFYNEFILFCEQIEAYRSAWEFMET